MVMNFRNAAAVFMTLSMGLTSLQAAIRERTQASFAAGGGGGQSTSYSVNADGTLWAWGSNNYGQLGNGGNQPSSTPVQVGSTSDWRMVTAGMWFAMGLTEHGSLWAWGCGFNGQLGNGTNPLINPDPVYVGTDFVTADAGETHAVAIKSDGTLWSWGRNEDGQLGDGGTQDRNRPVQVLHNPAGPSNTNWKEIACGQAFTIGLKYDGTLWAWGDYSYTGTGHTTNQLYPRQIGTENTWISVSSTVWHTLALKSNGTLWAWGSNNLGRLGDGTTSYRATPVAITAAGGNWVSISAGIEHSVAVKANGTVYAWGGNSHGQLGGAPSPNLTPKQVPSLDNVTLVAACDYHNLAFHGNTGDLYSWGKNQDGQLGRSTTTPGTPGLIGFYAGLGSAAGGVRHSGLVRGNSTLFTFGEGSGGKLGLGSSTSNRLWPEQVQSPLTGWREFTGGTTHSTALRTDGTIRSAGYNAYGQLGRGSVGSTSNTFQQIGTTNTWKQVSSGGEHTLGIRADGTLWAWGRNNYGQLGDNTLTNRSAPVQITVENPSVDNNLWVWVSAGGTHSAAMQANGTIWTWGRNNYGQLGLGSTTNYNHPRRVTSPSAWSAVQCGEYHIVGLRADGTLYAWGLNTLGQVGRGDFTSPVLSPVQIGTFSNWVGISAASSGNHTLATAADGLGYAWGKNANGQLGDGTTTNQNVPRWINYLYNYGVVYAGSNHSFNISDGQAESWGSNVQGQAGQGNETQVYYPTFFMHSY